MTSMECLQCALKTLSTSFTTAFFVDFLETLRQTERSRHFLRLKCVNWKRRHTPDHVCRLTAFYTHSSSVGGL